MMNGTRSSPRTSSSKPLSRWGHVQYKCSYEAFFLSPNAKAHAQQWRTVPSYSGFHRNIASPSKLPLPPLFSHTLFLPPLSPPSPLSLQSSAVGAVLGDAGSPSSPNVWSLKKLQHYICYVKTLKPVMTEEANQ